MFDTKRAKMTSRHPSEVIMDFNFYCFLRDFVPYYYHAKSDGN